MAYPPPGVVKQWRVEWLKKEGDAPVTEDQYIAERAADWELESCVNYVDNTISGNKARALRAHRRPKPPSLKEQALMALEDGDLGPGASLTPVEVCTIRRALEQLDD